MRWIAERMGRSWWRLELLCAGRGRVTYINVDGNTKDGYLWFSGSQGLDGVNFHGQIKAKSMKEALALALSAWKDAMSAECKKMTDASLEVSSDEAV